MALNPYTLNHLYQNGILDYVPTDLINTMPSPGLLSMNNPYLDMAKQGMLYQNSGLTQDSFAQSQYQSVGTNYGAALGSNNGTSAYNYNGQNGAVVTTGSMSNTGGMSAFNGIGIGRYNSNSIASSMGENGIVGTLSNAGGLNAFNGYNIGTQSSSGGINAFGGFTNNQNGFSKSISIIERTPKLLLGVIAGIIGTTGIIFAFKRCKKPVKTTQNKSFLSKMNPFNWFKTKK